MRWFHLRAEIAQRHDEVKGLSQMCTGKWQVVLQGKHSWKSELWLVAKPWRDCWIHACVHQACYKSVQGDHWGVRRPSRLQWVLKYDMVFCRKVGGRRRVLQPQQHKWSEWCIGALVVDDIRTHHLSHCWLTWSYHNRSNFPFRQHDLGTWFDKLVPGMKRKFFENVFVTECALT